MNYQTDCPHLKLLKRENALARFNDRQIFLIDNTKYLSVDCVSKRASITKSRIREKVFDEKKLSGTSGLVCLQSNRG